jgi:acylphosphatase
MTDISANSIGQRLLISGRVQGVFYRKFTQKIASALTLTGWTRNLLDGRVEVQAFGTTSQLADLQSKLWEGPPAAEVTDISVQTIAWEPYAHFQIIE